MYAGRAMRLRGGTNPKWLTGIPIPQPLLFAQTSVQSGDTVTGASEQTFSTTCSIPAGALRVGNVIRVDAQGVYSTAGTLGQTVAKVKFGSTTLCAMGNQGYTVNLTNRGWSIAAFITIVSTTAVEAQGFSRWATSNNSATDWEMKNTATVAVDTTAAQTLQLSMTQTNADAANTVTMRQLIVTILNP